MSNPRAAIFPIHLPDKAFLFDEPEFCLEGGAEEWGQLEDALAEWQAHDARDLTVPEKMAVGGFTYEGNYYFEFHSSVKCVLREFCLPTLLISDSDVSLKLSESLGRKEFVKMVESARERIADGDIYQVNLAREFKASITDLDPWEFFTVLNWVTEAPLAAFLPFADQWICSSSPELFLRMDGRRIETHPIKGTRPRDRDPLRDRQNAFELCTSEKEIAELVMITDLERNDLGKICEYGTVQVPELIKHEAFSHVHHLVSKVEGELRKGITPLSALKACFPGGSITGAPKKRAMEIIRELEPIQRGCYTGALGYFGSDGSAQFNIAIRTCEIKGDDVRFFTGSGITWGSDPEKEFEETQHKAEGMLQALRVYLASRKAASPFRS
ncbi:MAG: anthranilate synthase component I family protein [Verrucomicrobiota bacterium]